jgi:hypothetical protein
LKGTILVAELAAKLEQRDVVHDANTKELRDAVRRLTEEVARDKELRAKSVEIVSEEAKTMSDQYEAHIWELEEKHRCEMEAFEKKYQDFASEQAKVMEQYNCRLREGNAREKRVEDHVRLLNRRLCIECLFCMFVFFAGWRPAGADSGEPGCGGPGPPAWWSFICLILFPVFSSPFASITPPTEVGELINWLAHAPGRVDEWRASAARAGMDIALSFVLSWYDEVKLSQLEARQAGASLPTEELRTRAIALARYTDVDTFITDPDEPAISEEEADAAEEVQDEEVEDGAGGDVVPDSSGSQEF